MREFMRNLMILNDESMEFYKANIAKLRRKYLFPCNPFVKGN